MEQFTIVELEEHETVIAVGTRKVNLTLGKAYKVKNGLEKGIFPNSPYVTVVNDEGDEVIYHASRFIKVSAWDKWQDVYNPL